MIMKSNYKKETASYRKYLEKIYGPPINGGIPWEKYENILKNVVGLTDEEYLRVEDFIISIYQASFEIPGYNVIEIDGSTRGKKIVSSFLAQVMEQKKQGKEITEGLLREIISMPIYPV